jgi:hypothetical protein
VLLNLFIHFLRPFVLWLSIPDALALLLLQSAILLTGIAAVKSFHPSSDNVSESSIKWIASWILSTNALFIALLVFYLVQEGWQNLLALISF